MNTDYIHINNDSKYKDTLRAVSCRNKRFQTGRHDDLWGRPMATSRHLSTTKNVMMRLNVEKIFHFYLKLRIFSLPFCVYTTYAKRQHDTV